MDIILGIDLGTTNSVASVVINGEIQLIKKNGEAILPSVVGLDEAGNLLVGRAARNQAVLAPERTIKSIKRKMGVAATVSLGDQEYTPQEISAMILRRLKEHAEEQLGQPVAKAVITVPAFFNEIQREATREAGELAGLEVVRIINEPTAASLTYEAKAEHLERLLVYDLGGGTFDVSVVQMEQGIVEVLASHGDTKLGGDDFDDLLLDHVADAFQKKHDIDLRMSLIAKSRLLRACEDAKIALSAEPFATIELEFIAEKDGHPLHLVREIERAEYEDLIEALISKTLVCVDESLSDAKLQAPQIDKVILVGGSSRTPLVQRLLEERLQQPLHTEVDPDLSVAMGAAVQGALIAGVDVGPILVDITPHTLGIQALGYHDGLYNEFMFAPIIPRLSALPANKSEMFSTASDGQKAVIIAVYQGENSDVRRNEKVGEFKLEGLAEVEAGNEILVRFNLNQDGILTVTVMERATGLEKRLTIDNAMEKFRQKNRDAARSRIDAAFNADPATAQISTKPILVKPTKLAKGIVPAELQRDVDEAYELLLTAQKLIPEATPEDAAELLSLTGRLEKVLAMPTAEALKTAVAELEDLVFYLQDA